MRAALHSDQNRESGLTLVEVVVAIVILGLLASTALGLYLTSMTASKSHQHREVAITVANEAMELAASWSVPNLADGRSQSAVAAQWAAGGSVSGIAATYPLWDLSATASSVPDLPLSAVSTFSGTDYTIETYIGQCFQPEDAATLASGGDCTKVSGHPSSPPATAPGMTKLLRVIVNVRWTAGDACDPVAGCTYQTSTMVDPTLIDVEWIR